MTTQPTYQVRDARTARPEVQSILHFTIGGIERMDDQQFFETPKTWELWQMLPLPRRMCFWRSSSIVGEYIPKAKDTP